MKRFILLSIIFIGVFCGQLQAQDGYQIEVEVDNFPTAKAYLAVRRADKTYSQDTAFLEKGKFVFEGEKALPTGIYLLLLPPANKFFEFIITPTEQRFSMKTDTINLFKNLTFNNAPDNQVFYDYRKYMGEKIPASNQMREQMEKEVDEKKKVKLQQEVEKLVIEVENHQQEVLAKNQGTFSAKLINSWIEIPIPDVPADEDEQTFRFKHYRAHFWDNWDFSEPGFVRTPYLIQKIDQYLDRLTAQVPDSLKIAVDFIGDSFQGNSEGFRTALGHMINKYYQPKIVGLDEVFVHLAYKYYCGANPVADWMDEDGKKKICDDAYMIRGVLIGNQAPDVTTQLYDYELDNWTEEKISLYDVKADFTIVFLWKPGCPACKKTTEELKKFYAKYQNNGVEIFAISSATFKELDKARKDVQTKNPSWITTADPYLKARALQKFYGVSMPKIYLLDKNKKIIASRVGVEQLEEIIEKERLNKND